MIYSEIEFSANSFANRRRIFPILSEYLYYKTFQNENLSSQQHMSSPNFFGGGVPRAGLFFYCGGTENCWKTVKNQFKTVKFSKNFEKPANVWKKGPHNFSNVPGFFLKSSVKEGGGVYWVCSEKIKLFRFEFYTKNVKNCMFNVYQPQ